MAVGATNPQSYQMAFAMGKSLNPDLTKAFLLEKSNFYISEIEKVYTKYDATGNSKNKNLLAAINTQKSNLSKEISDLETQIAKLQQELESKKAQFLKIDSENGQEFNEIQQKIEANNIAKQKILESINVVVTGINQYL
jgi:peptidoglycan hydrolase CwlO-like protein